MSDPQGFDWGTTGGIVAGVLAALGTAGAGIRWTARWLERRASTRAAKLQEWHAELKAREKEHLERVAAWEAKLEARVKLLEQREFALRHAFDLVAMPLRALDPGNQNLAQAERLIERAFALDLSIPSDIETLLGKLE